MRGFSHYALILLSDPKKFDEASALYKRDYMQALTNLIIYLKGQDIEPTFLVTDPLARTLCLDLPDIYWQETEDRGGMYFLFQSTFSTKTTWPLPVELKQKMDEKHPITRGMPQNARMFALSKRVAIAEKAFIEQAPCVFVFGNLFRPKAKVNDGRAVFTINNQFIPSLKLSGNDTPINSFLGIDWGNQALTEWGKHA